MPLIIHPLVLRPMDCLHCGESPEERPVVKLWHRLTRTFVAGWQRAKDASVAVHTAIVYQIRKELLVVEMIGPKTGLRISSLELTHDGKPRNVLGVSRYAIYDDLLVRNTALERIDYDIRKTIEYDPKGCLEFAFKRIEDDPDRLICSEYFYIHAKLDGQKFPTRFEKRVSPWDLQCYKDKGVISIAGY